MKQGFEANLSGRMLEQLVEREFAVRGFLIKNYAEDNGNTDLLNQRRLVRHVPYTSLYGNTSRSEFVAYDDACCWNLRIECRNQTVPGSVDEKYPFLLRNAVECMPEENILIVLGGRGARIEANRWLIIEAKKITVKNICVVNMNDFALWMRKNVPEPVFI